MTSTTSEAQRDTSHFKTLASHYRAIGPAAILAALLCTPRTRAKSAPGLAKKH